MFVRAYPWLEVFHTGVFIAASLFFTCLSSTFPMPVQRQPERRIGVVPQTTRRIASMIARRVSKGRAMSSSGRSWRPRRPNRDRGKCRLPQDFVKVYCQTGYSQGCYRASMNRVLYFEKRAISGFALLFDYRLNSSFRFAIISFHLSPEPRHRRPADRCYRLSRR
jgi:hypothetical protein